MPKEFDYLAAARAASERIAGPLGRARILFKNISRKLDVPTAKMIFQLCAHEASGEAAAEKKQPRREPMKLPTIAQIDGANRAKICMWWDRLRHTDQRFSKSEQKIIDRLWARYYEFGGYPEGYKEGKFPPIKQEGARRRNTPKAAELPAMFGALKIKHPKFNNARIAEIIADQHGTIYGKSAEAIERAERKWRKKNRKV
jgi:hypothetical protein